MGKPDRGQRGWSDVQPDPGLDLGYHLCLSFSLFQASVFVPHYSADVLVTHASEVV